MRKVFFVSFLLTVSFSTAHSTELVFGFENPAFGGNPLYGVPLLNNAQAQKDFSPPSRASTRVVLTPLQKFNETLQRTVLNRLSSNVASQIIGRSGDLTPGSVETSDFFIEIVDLGDNQVTVTTTDKVTGDSTSFTIDNGL